MTDRFVMTTPIGPLALRVDVAGLRHVDFRPAAPPDTGPPPPGLLREAADQLEAYFAGERTAFSLPLSVQGTSFQRQVWAALLDIPYAATSSYGAVAARLGPGTSPRAVGTANGRNPLPIVVPCHRVIGADGSLVGFGGGLPVKRHLLRLEARVSVERGLTAHLDVPSVLF